MSSVWNGILGLLGSLLAVCYSLINNYMFAIALFTLIIMVLFTPLTIKSTRSMMAMQQIQPEMKALQAKYRDDKQTLNTEMMALYQRHGVNPLGGCLPMLVQLPVFFALFSLLRGLTRKNDIGTEFDPRHLDANSQLFKDLSSAGAEMLSFGMDLSRQANDVVQESLVTSIPYVAMVVITGLTSWLQQRQMAARRTPGQEIPQQQQMLMKILPWTLPIFAFFMPSALFVYFIVSNLWRVGQQSYISRKIHKPAAALGTQAPIETDVVENGTSGKINGDKPKKTRNPKPVSENRVVPTDPDRPRPRPRQRSSRPEPKIEPVKKERGRSRSNRAERPSGESRPAPTGRTAGHGPPKRPATKKKKR